MLECWSAEWLVLRILEVVIVAAAAAAAVAVVTAAAAAAAVVGGGVGVVVAPVWRQDTRLLRDSDGSLLPSKL